MKLVKLLFLRLWDFINWHVFGHDRVIDERLKQISKWTIR